ncbi:MAG: hypothetical protein EOL87_13775 [Spartobacteria bacterium]|nr:hypothetical protein [Spartobacteria bacterium]
MAPIIGTFPGLECGDSGTPRLSAFLTHVLRIISITTSFYTPIYCELIKSVGNVSTRWQRTPKLVPFGVLSKISMIALRRFARLPQIIFLAEPQRSPRDSHKNAHNTQGFFAFNTFVGGTKVWKSNANGVTPHSPWLQDCQHKAACIPFRTPIILFRTPIIPRIALCPRASVREKQRYTPRGSVK